MVGMHLARQAKLEEHWAGEHGDCNVVNCPGCEEYQASDHAEGLHAASPAPSVCEDCRENGEPS